MAVAEVARDDRHGIGRVIGHAKGDCLGVGEGAVAVAHEDGDGAHRGIGHGQIDVAVAEVARDDRRRRPRHRNRRQGVERAVAVSQKDLDCAVLVITVRNIRLGDGQVGAAVVVEVGRHDR